VVPWILISKDHANERVYVACRNSRDGAAPIYRVSMGLPKWSAIGMLRFLRLGLSIFVTALLALSLVPACSVRETIWGIRSRTADPLFGFVRNGSIGYIEVAGRIVVEPKLPTGDRFSGEFHEGLLAIKYGGSTFYVDTSGRTVFTADAWLAFDFSEGLAPASRFAGFPRWGFIDHTGKFAIPAQYYWVDPFSEGLARVAVASEVGSTGYIDKSGQFFIPPDLTYGGSFSEGRAAVIIDGPPSPERWILRSRRIRAHQPGCGL
jgi:WG containing repeat